MRRTRGLTLVELLVVMGIMMILASMLLPVLHRAKESSRRVVCGSNLRQVLMALSLYADEHRGYYPPKDDIDENAIMEGSSVFPEYIPDLNLLGCPSNIYFEKGVTFTRDGKQDPECLTNMSYLYSGYLLTNDTEVSAAIQAYMNGFGQQFGAYPTETRDDDIDLSKIGLSGHGNLGSDIIYRTRTQVTGMIGHEVWYVPKRGIPVITDQIGPNIMYFSHRPFGANIGYMDGHVEFVKYELPLDSRNFPVSPFMVSWAQHMLPPDLTYIGCK